MNKHGYFFTLFQTTPTIFKKPFIFFPYFVSNIFINILPSDTNNSYLIEIIHFVLVVNFTYFL